jgi:HTH-type transcriptional regulator, competence development regulator
VNKDNKKENAFTEGEGVMSGKTNNNNALGKLLEELRGNRSLREISQKTGLSHTYIRDIELGRRRVTNTPIKPSAYTLKKLAEAYNYSFVELMRLAGLEDELRDQLAKEHDLYKVLTSESEDVVYKGIRLSEQQKENIMSFIDFTIKSDGGTHEEYRQD